MPSVKNAPAHTVGSRFRSLGAACEFFRLPRNKEYFAEVISYGNAGLTRLGIDAPQLTLCTARKGFTGAFADRLGLGSLLSSRIAPRGERLHVQDRGKVLTQMAIVIAGGGKSCADIEHLRFQSDLFGHMASDSTAHRTFHELDGAALVELAKATVAVRAKARTLSTKFLQLVHRESRDGATGAGKNPLEEPTRYDLVARRRNNDPLARHCIESLSGDHVGRSAPLGVQLGQGGLSVLPVAAHGRCLDDAGVDDARAEHRDADVGTGQLTLECFAECDDGRLGCGVRCHSGVGYQPGHRGGVDDVRGPFLLEQTWEKRVQPVHHAHQVDVDKPSPVLERCVGHDASVADAGVVEQQVDRAVLENAVGELVDCGGVGDVQGMGRGVSTRGTHLLGDGLGARDVEIGDVNEGASLAQQPRDRPADTRACAGHHGRLARQITGVDAGLRGASGWGDFHANSSESLGAIAARTIKLTSLATLSRDGQLPRPRYGATVSITGMRRWRQWDAPMTLTNDVAKGTFTKVTFVLAISCAPLRDH